MVAGLPEDVASEGEIPQDRIARIETAEQTIGWL
jgi:probable phosphoglycerate mutase